MKAISSIEQPSNWPRGDVSYESNPSTDEKRVVKIQIKLPKVSQLHTRQFQNFEKRILPQYSGVNAADSDETLEELLVAIYQNKDEDIRKVLRGNPEKNFISQYHLKSKQTVNLHPNKDGESQETEMELFIDILQFCVLMERSKALEIILSDHVRRYGPKIYDQLGKSNIRLNSIENIDKKNFQYEDVKLDGRSILHLAADGRVDCLKVLVARLPNLHEILKLQDKFGRTAVHVASENSKMETLELLDLSNNKDALFIKDEFGNYPLHYAVQFGEMDSIFFIAKIIRDLNLQEFVNKKNANGKSPIFYARNVKSLYLLLALGADPTLRNLQGQSLLEHFINTNTGNAKALLNYEIGTLKDNTEDGDTLYAYNLRLFDKEEDECIPRQKWSSSEMGILVKFLTYKKKHILSAPLTDMYLHCKWSLMEKVFLAHLFLHVLQLIPLTAFVYWTTNEKRSFVSNCSEGESESFLSFIDNQAKKTVWIGLHTILLLSLLLSTFLFYVQLFNRSKLHQLSKLNDILYMTTSIFYLIATISNLLDVDAEGNIASLAVSFGWIRMSLIIGQHPSFSPYAIMSKKLIQKIFKFLVVYFPTMVAVSCIYTKCSDLSSLLMSLLKLIFFKTDDFDIPNISEFADPFKLPISLGAPFLASLMIGLTLQNITEVTAKYETYSLYVKSIYIWETEYMIFKSMLSKLMKFCLPAKLFCRIEDSLMFKTFIKKKQYAEFIFFTKPNEKKGIFNSLDIAYNLYSKTRKGKHVEYNLRIDIPEGIIAKTEKVLAEKMKILNEIETEFASLEKSVTSQKLNKWLQQYQAII